jgi:hypothetical protein
MIWPGQQFFHPVQPAYSQVVVAHGYLYRYIFLVENTQQRLRELLRAGPVKTCFGVIVIKSPRGFLEHGGGPAQQSAFGQSDFNRHLYPPGF